MKKNSVFMFAAAVAALLLAGCDKEQQGYDSFILDIAGFNGADGSKAYWDDQGFWWVNTTSTSDGDVVRINGDVHHIYRDGDQWKTHAAAATNPIDGNYYIAYAGNGDLTGVDLGWDSGSKLYGPVTFDGTIVPLARSGSGNRMTLDPCCAVIKGASHVDFFLNNPEEDESKGVISGVVYASGYISPANSSIVDGERLDYENGIDGDGEYIIIPLGNEPVTAYLQFDFERNTTKAVTLKKGYFYNVSQ